MSQLSNANVLSVDQFDRPRLVELFEVADSLRDIAEGKYRCTALEGAVLANLFFEPSTRTRTSFGSAFLRLGGQLLETADESSSSLAKGESLEDTARVMSGYADVVVVRHHEVGSVARYATASSIPVINAGDGSGEHPTQALLDGYTLARELGREDFSLDGTHIAMVGDLRYSRTVHSFAKLLSTFDSVTFSFISPEDLKMPPAVLDVLSQRGHAFREYRRLIDGLRNADAIYATRIQEERLGRPELAHQYRGRLAINREAYERFAPHRPILMHPLPRDSRITPMELADDLEDLDTFAVFRQARNGVPIRMAVFAQVLGLDPRYVQYETKKKTFRHRQENWNREDKVISTSRAKKVAHAGQLSLENES
jgi:aspartate carbamoyltransferase catalytic subunit